MFVCIYNIYIYIHTWFSPALVWWPRYLSFPPLGISHDYPVAPPRGNSRSHLSVRSIAFSRHLNGSFQTSQLCRYPAKETSKILPMWSIDLLDLRMVFLQMVHICHNIMIVGRRSEQCLLKPSLGLCSSGQGAIMDPQIFVGRWRHQFFTDMKFKP